MTTLTLGHDTASDIFPSYARWLEGRQSTEQLAEVYTSIRMPLETPKVIECVAYCLHNLQERAA